LQAALLSLLNRSEQDKLQAKKKLQTILLRRKKKEKEKLAACRGEGIAAGPLLVVLRCRFAALLYIASDLLV
jgi:hypothetical protein